MSGYADNAVLRNGPLADAASFLPKPVTPSALVDKVSTGRLFVIQKSKVKNDLNLCPEPLP